MRRTILFIVGAAGVGKTTLVRGLLGFNITPESLAKAKQVGVLQPPMNLSLVEKPKWTVVGKGGLVAAGHYNGLTFDGGDTVPYNGAQAALEFWERELAPKAELSIFDGDRFSNDKARQWLRARSDRMLHLLLTGNPNDLAARRADRGSDQNQTWLRGRETKAQNFYNTGGTGLTLEQVELAAREGHDRRIDTTGMSPLRVLALAEEWLEAQAARG